MPLVIVRLAAERAPIGQLEIALGPFQRLDRRLLIHRQHQRAVGRIEIKPDDLLWLPGIPSGRIHAVRQNQCIIAKSALGLDECR